PPDPPVLLAPAPESRPIETPPVTTGEHPVSGQTSVAPPSAAEDVPATGGTPVPSVVPGVSFNVPMVTSPAAPGLPVVLYPHVRVKDPHKAHPLSVPTIIPVPDPRDRRGIVHIEVCMPPCVCKDFKCNRRGTRARYDFGEYKIQIIARRGVVTIDYDS